MASPMTQSRAGEVIRNIRYYILILYVYVYYLTKFIKIQYRYKLILSDVTLSIPVLQMTEEVYKKVMAETAKKEALLHIKRTYVFTQPIPAGSTSFFMDSLFQVIHYLYNIILVLTTETSSQSKPRLVFLWFL